jgi:hypothetical protein
MAMIEPDEPAPVTPMVYRGVEMQVPPASIMPSISAALAKAVAEIPPDKSGALMGIVTERGVNLAVVHRVGDNFTVSAWIGRSWVGASGSAFECGAQAKLTW